MIGYFSATGSTRFVSKVLARELSEQAVDLTERIRSFDFSAIGSQTPFVFCAPTYAAIPPRFFTDWLREVELTGSSEIYFISVSGGYSGVSGPLVGRVVRAKGMRYQGFAEVRMPSNYIAHRSHKGVTAERVQELTDAAREQLIGVASSIAAGEPLKGRHVWLIEHLIDEPFETLAHGRLYTTDGFWVRDTCMGCGLCERRCPVGAIQMRDGRPKWFGRTCAHCMACIQTCPAEAIEYGEVTVGRRRYQLSATGELKSPRT